MSTINQVEFLTLDLQVIPEVCTRERWLEYKKDSINRLNLQGKELAARILGLIANDEATAINLETLCSYTGLSKREMKVVITDLRQSHPIVSKETEGGGYWYATTRKEVYDFCDMIRRRMDGYQRTINKMLAHTYDGI